MVKISEIPHKFFKEGKFQSKLSEDIVQCETCEHQCKIKKNETGFCGTRINFNNTIYSLVYGAIPAISVNPIEKKPLFHFYPGTKAITMGTYGCNFDCFWCQNHHLSHPKTPIYKKVKKKRGLYVSPEKIIEIAIKNNCQGTSISFNEPTLLFEYALDIFSLAKENDLYNTYVSNGYMTKKVLKKLAKYGLDAINIDIKGGKEMVKKYCKADVEKVWRNAQLAIDLGIHTEITVLIIEGYNSNKKTIKNIANQIKKDLGSEIVLHLNRFFPHYKAHEYNLENPTNLEVMKRSYETAKNTGLEYVYMGNMPSNKYQYTICPNCATIIVRRDFQKVKISGLNEKGECKECGKFIFDKIEIN